MCTTKAPQRKKRKNISSNFPLNFQDNLGLTRSFRDINTAGILLPSQMFAAIHGNHLTSQAR